MKEAFYIAHRFWCVSVGGIFLVAVNHNCWHFAACLDSNISQDLYQQSWTTPLLCLFLFLQNVYSGAQMCTIGLSFRHTQSTAEGPVVNMKKRTQIKESMSHELLQTVAPLVQFTHVHTHTHPHTHPSTPSR
jgi:hypothetical protein